MQPTESNSNEALLAKVKQLEDQVKLRTDQLIASTSRAYSFLDSLNMGFIMCDVNAQVVLVNAPARQILASKMVGNDDHAPIATPDQELTLDVIDGLLQPDLALKQRVQQSLTTNESAEFDAINFGKRVLHVSIAPMLNETSPGNKQQIGIVILVEDITEQKVLERSKDEFLSIASHELRTPLTAIRGNSALLQKYYGDKMPDKDMVEMVSDIHESSIRLIGIVNDFLDVSALEQGKIRMNPEPVQMDEIVTAVIRELQTLCDSKGITLVKDQSLVNAPLVTADKQRIKQVIYNLVGNASKFTENGSITVSLQSDDHYVYTYVTDTGRGMSVENQRLLFRKFQQAGSSLLTRDTVKGTGLGLYISKLIVELTGGKIGLQSSEINKGSTFVFSLPRVKA